MCMAEFQDPQSEDFWLQTLSPERGLKITPELSSGSKLMLIICKIKKRLWKRKRNWKMFPKQRWFEVERFHQPVGHDVVSNKIVFY